MKMCVKYLVPISALMLAGCENAQQQFAGRLAGCAETVNGLLYVMGGMTLSANIPDVGAYDPSSKTWAHKAHIPTPRATAASALLGNEIYIVGGRNENAALPNHGEVCYPGGQVATLLIHAYRSLGSDARCCRWQALRTWRYCWYRQQQTNARRGGSVRPSDRLVAVFLQYA